MKDPAAAGRRFLKGNPKALVDLDATLAQFTEWRGQDDIGDPIPGAKEAVRLMIMMGWKVMVFTCRSEVSTKKWLSRHGFPKLPVNKVPRGWNPPGHASIKPYSDLIIDDRAWPYPGQTVNPIPDPSRQHANMTAKTWYELIKHIQKHPRTRGVMSSQYFPTIGYLKELRQRHEREPYKPRSLFKNYLWKLPWW